MSFTSIAELAYSKGFRTDIGVKTLNPNSYSYGPLNPNAPYDGVSESGFFERYGLNFREIKGNIVGERFSSEVLNDLFRYPGNPLDLSPSFNPYSALANSDSKFIKGYYPISSFWDDFILPLYRELFPPVVEPPPPPPPPPPVDPPEDPPVDPPPPPVVEPLSPRIPEAAYRKLRAKVNLFSVMGPLKYQALQSVLDYLDALRKWQDEDEVE